MGLLSRFFIFLLLSFCLVTPRYNRLEAAQSEMDPKMKALLLTCGYGAALGTMLGMATVAFGAQTRAIPQGASLGLYAGIIFGAYIIYSHDQKVGSEYRDAVTPYDDGGGSTNPYGPQGDVKSHDNTFVGVRMAQLVRNQPRPWNISLNLISIKF